MKVIQPFLSLGKIVADKAAYLRLLIAHLLTHCFIAGGSGNGKSKMIEMLCRQLAAQGYGFTLIDPHGDTAESVMYWLAVRAFDPKRTHYLKPTSKRMFRMDPFAHPPKGVSRLKYRMWLRSTNDSMTSFNP